MDKVYILWDDVDKYDVSVVYKDIKSAEFALKVKYTDHFINSGRAKVEPLKLLGFE